MVVLLVVGNARMQTILMEALQKEEGKAAMDVLRMNLATAAEWASNPAARIDRKAAVSRAFQENGRVNVVCSAAQALSDASQAWPALPFWAPGAVRSNVHRRRLDIIISD